MTILGDLIIEVVGGFFFLWKISILLIGKNIERLLESLNSCVRADLFDGLHILCCQLLYAHVQTVVC